MSQKPRKKTFMISKGEIAGFADELDLKGVEVESVVTKRVSRILPKNVLLAAAFCAIRAIVKDESTVAQWTREWRCRWMVTIAGKQYGPFECREKAITFEKKLIAESGAMFSLTE